MGDVIRLDLSGKNKAYIDEVLNSFIDDAPSHGRRLMEIRMSKTMSQRLSFEGMFRGVSIAIADVGFEDTIEVVLTQFQ